MRVLSTPAATGLRVATDGLAARRELRRQIARLEREIETAVASLPPAGRPLAAAGRTAVPHLTTLAELEVTRDALSVRLSDVRAAVARRGDEIDAARAELERMLLDPGSHRFRRITNEQLG